MNKEFTKSDLKTGMIVKFRDMGLAILKNGRFINSEDEHMGFISDYTEMLIDEEFDDYDIMKVYDFKDNIDVRELLDIIIGNYVYLSELIEKNYVELIWEREKCNIIDIRRMLKEE